MAEIGQPGPALVAAVAFVLAAATSAVTWPFAIDDAFISVRYARHLASGAGYVWNVGGPATDGVTPLPWAFMLVPLARGAPADVLVRAKLAGAIVWAVAAALLGRGVGRLSAPWWTKALAIALLAVDVPLAAHSASGMETAFATALATLGALLFDRPRLAAVVAGMAAALRPELVVWSVVVASGFAVVKGPRTPFRVAIAGGLSALPFVACALIRRLAFGRVAPLAVLAKPSDLAHGIAYAGAAALFTLAPILVVAPAALLRERGPGLVLTVAACAHLAVIVAVGGDWMPYARLMVPIVPSLILAFVLVARHAHPVAHALRAALALALGGTWFPGNVRALRSAGADRSALIAAASPFFTSARCIAAVDIGWVSSVSEATIVDLAGVTDPEIAALGGGHTSKRVDASLLLARSPDLVVFYSNPLPPVATDATPQSFPRTVESRLARSELFASKFAPAAIVPLGTKGAGYVFFQRR